jgi:hypothetical protein
MAVERLEPRARRLFQSMQGLGQEAHMVGMIVVDEAHMLLIVDTLGEITVQEHILHVQLVHRPVV